jgi:hypothetical protein
MSTYQEYAKWGWPTFPVAGPVYASDKSDYKTWKAPLVNWKEFQNRLPTLDEVNLWEKKWPLAYIGVTTGPFSNLFVIDTDGEKGSESLASLAIPMPITKVSKTQRGFHYFFKWSKRLEGFVTSRNGLFPGLDIKGDGGFIIIPSTGGNRQWVCDEFCAELPDAWYQHLTKAEALPKNWQAKAIAELSLGNRHDTFVRLISSCFNAGWEIESIMAVLQPFAEKHKLDESLEALILDVQQRYFPPVIDKTKARFEEMQNRARELTAKLSGKNPTNTKLDLQDLYDEAASRWVKDSIPWKDSQAAYLALQLIS